MGNQLSKMVAYSDPLNDRKIFLINSILTSQCHVKIQKDVDKILENIQYIVRIAFTFVFMPASKRPRAKVRCWRTSSKQSATTECILFFYYLYIAF